MSAGGPDPYGGSGYGMPPNPYGGPGYGHPAMMGGPQMHGASYGGMGGSGGGGKNTLHNDNKHR